ncbi:MAG: hypothetical protein IPI31_02400 [Bacteroidetes bacterium]|nr:hypothetical protein [Bacteroidota bacterium]
MRKYYLFIIILCTFLNGMANSNKIVKNDTLNFAANVDSIAFYLTLSPERTLEINVKNNSKDVLLIDTVHFSIGVRKIGDSIVSYYADNNPVLINAHIDLNLILLKSGDSLNFSLKMMNVSNMVNSKNIDFTLFYIREQAYKFTQNKYPIIFKVSPNNVNYNHFIELHNY